MIQFDVAALDVLTLKPDGKNLIYKDVSGRDPNLGLWHNRSTAISRGHSSSQHLKEIIGWTGQPMGRS
jgi:hypothetical protein